MLSRSVGCGWESESRYRYNGRRKRRKRKKIGKRTSEKKAVIVCEIVSIAELRGLN
jgi:uncharacterized protein YbbK (DUF523 family)